jgi:hypothetical protein
VKLDRFNDHQENNDISIRPLGNSSNCFLSNGLGMAGTVCDGYKSGGRNAAVLVFYDLGLQGEYDQLFLWLDRQQASRATTIMSDDRTAEENPQSHNLHKRPAPGKPKVFFSFHAPDFLVAMDFKRVFERHGIDVIAYDPENRWPDGPMVMAEQIVSQCHCVVFIGNPGGHSRFVRFEHAVANNVGIPLLVVRRVKDLRKVIPKIHELSQLPPKTLWPQSVSNSIQQALNLLELSDFSDSRIAYAGQTGFDLFSRTGQYEMNQMIDDAIKAKVKPFPPWMIVSALVVAMSALVGLVFGLVALIRWLFHR